MPDEQQDAKFVLTPADVDRHVAAFWAEFFAATAAGENVEEVFNRFFDALDGEANSAQH